MQYLSKSQLALLVIAALYLVSPVDIVPELVLGPLGITDDAAAVAAVTSMLLLARNRAKDGAVPVPVRADVR